MNLKTRLTSVAWLGGGLAMGTAAWAVVIGLQTPSTPSTKFEQPAAATSSVAVTTTPAPVLKAPVVKKQFIAPLVDSDTPTATEEPTTDSPMPIDTVTTGSGDGTQGPQAPPAIPTYQPSPPPTPPHRPTPSTSAPVELQ